MRHKIDEKSSGGKTGKVRIEQEKELTGSLGVRRRSEKNKRNVSFLH